MTQVILLVHLLLFLCLPVFAAEMSHDNMQKMTDPGHDHEKMVAMADADAKVELNEQLGAQIPLDLSFYNSTGQQVQLRQLIDKPTLVVPVFYECRNVCNFLLGGIARILPDIKLQAGEDYNIVTFSFDPTEKPELAAHSKQTFLTAIQAPFPKESWHFLTGKQEDILKLTDAAGYHFKKQGDDFLHPIAAFVVTGEGKIVRYLTGQRFVPLDVTMALIEASENRIGTPLRKAMEFCFSYDPQGRKYVFNLLRVSGTVILLTLGSFLSYLMFSGRKKK